MRSIALSSAIRQRACSIFEFCMDASTAGTLDSFLEAVPLVDMCCEDPRTEKVTDNVGAHTRP